MKFLRYTLGEILLVVIGILIVLQINNWNEERVEQKEIREYALNLSAAIERRFTAFVFSPRVCGRTRLENNRRSS